ncbi:MAG: cysteine-rich small domain-containing protein [Archaeoglobales archaeon]|nr:cysteine-rich small domain-containing protein [Archaeoglobales archaeon]
MRERALQDLFAAMEKINGPAYECRYYPCHFESQDCSLCFCPFYPCFLYVLGGSFVPFKNSLIWSCKNCHWVHKRENVEEILIYLSTYPRQRLVEEDWFFYSKIIQDLIFGEELGVWIGDCYNLIPANQQYYKNDEALLIELSNFEIANVLEIHATDIEKLCGILVPKKL